MALPRLPADTPHVASLRLQTLSPCLSTRVRASAARAEGKAAAAPQQGKRAAHPPAEFKAPFSKGHKGPASKGPKAPSSKGAKPQAAAEREAAERRERRRLRRARRQGQEQGRQTADAAPGDSRPPSARQRRKAKSGSDISPSGAATDARANRNKAQLETALRRFRSGTFPGQAQPQAQAQAQARGYQSEDWDNPNSGSPGSPYSTGGRRSKRHQELRFSFADPEPTPLGRIAFWAYGMERAVVEDPAEPLGTEAAAEAEERERQSRATLERVAGVWSRSPEAGQFSAALEALVVAMAPDDEDHRLRKQLVERVWQCISRSRHCSRGMLLAFGSFESDLYARWGDMDLCLLLGFPTSRDNKRRVLDAACACLVPSGLIHAYPERVFHARVPLLIFTDRATNLSCDLSVGNAGGFIKSRVLRWVCSLDDRCRPLMFLVKCWAQAAGINDPKNGTLNSYALCLLVLFHLQTCSPPVLPPLSRVLGAVHDANGAVPEEENRERREALLRGIEDRIEQIRRSGEFGDGSAAGPGGTRGRNKSSLGALFASFFSKYAVMSDLWAQGLAVRPFAGRWGDLSLPLRFDANKTYAMMVEDPFDLRENCARSVQPHTVDQIAAAIQGAADDLRAPPQAAATPALRARLFDWPPGADVPNFVAKKMGGSEARRDAIRAQRQGMGQPPRQPRQPGPPGRLWSPGQQPEGYNAPGRGPGPGRGPQQPFRGQPQMQMPLPQHQGLAGEMQHAQEQQWAHQRRLGGAPPHPQPVLPQPGSPAWHQQYPPPGFPPLAHPQLALGSIPPGAPAGMLPLGLAGQVLRTGGGGLEVHHQAAALGGPGQGMGAPLGAVPGGLLPPPFRGGAQGQGNGLPGPRGQPPHAQPQQWRQQGAGQGKREPEDARSWRPLAHPTHPHGAPPSAPSPTPPQPALPVGLGTPPESELRPVSDDPSANRVGPREAEGSGGAHQGLGRTETSHEGGVAEPGASTSRTGREQGAGNGGTGTEPRESNGGIGTQAGASNGGTGTEPGAAPLALGEQAAQGRGRQEAERARKQKKLQRKRVEDQRRAQTKDRKYEELVMEVGAHAPALGPLPGQHTDARGHTQGSTVERNSAVSGTGEGPYKVKTTVRKYELVGPMVGAGGPASVGVGAAAHGGLSVGAGAEAPGGAQRGSESLEAVTMQLASILGVAKGGAPLAAPAAPEV